MTTIELLEAASYVVTIVGLPLAILVFVREQRRERQNDQEEIYQRLSDDYTSFLKLALDNADLHLLRKQGADPLLTDDQRERKYTLLNILVYEDRMDRQTRRLWLSWEDYMREWCRRRDFREVLPELLPGEDEDFAAHNGHIAQAEADHPGPDSP
jgi:hypothetical protein